MLEMRTAIGRGKKRMRTRLPQSYDRGRHVEICGLFGAVRQTPPGGLVQGAIKRRYHLRALHSFWRCHRRSRLGRSENWIAFWNPKKTDKCPACRPAFSIGPNAPARGKRADNSKRCRQRSDGESDIKRSHEY